jgi:hypothetical protein
MAFLDNSGDIILDAVLTDTGRFRLAQGNGSFKIAKFALGDDEIDYSLYDKTNVSGSAYYDLSILQTPVLEAFTNNASSLKSKLLTITRTNLLYLPVIKLNNTATRPYATHTSGLHLVSCSPTTLTVSGSAIGSVAGVINGISNDKANIRVDQGLDSDQGGQGTLKTDILQQDLKETQYIVEMDNRLGTIVPATQSNITPASYSFLDDDNMATYNFSLNVSNNNNIYVEELPRVTTSNGSPDNDQDSNTIVKGARGTKITFSIKASTQLQSTDHLFNTLGSTTTVNSVLGVKYIDTTVRVTGATTGYRLDIPVRFIKV